MEAGSGLGEKERKGTRGEGQTGEAPPAPAPKGNLEETITGITIANIWTRGSRGGTLGRWELGGAAASAKGRVLRAHLWQWGPCWHRLDPLLLLVLLLLKLLGQLQVAKTQRALWLLLLQGQGDQVILERGKNKGCEVGCSLGDIQARFRFPNQFFLSLQFL